jgi:hypothetical protein
MAMLNSILQDEAKSEKSSMDKGIQEGGGQGDDNCGYIISLILKLLFLTKPFRIQRSILRSAEMFLSAMTEN